MGTDTADEHFKGSEKPYCVFMCVYVYELHLVLYMYSHLVFKLNCSNLSERSLVFLFLFLFFFFSLSFSGSSAGTESSCKAGDPGSIPESGRSSGEGNGNPLQYSCLENPMDREA